MVAKGGRNRSESPNANLSVRVELDNRALKAKNTNLTQTVARLQQENAELVKQVTLLQRQSFETDSKYNNLKNVVSIINSTTKTCLPKLNEIIETFTGIIQLCSVAANIANLHNFSSPGKKDARTQAVKPQIVNGHILLNPTITLSRLNNEDSASTPPRSDATPSTSRDDSDEINADRDRLSNRVQEQDNNDGSDNVNEEQELSFLSRANRPSRRTQSAEMSRRLADEFEDSDEENEEPIEEEESEQRLATIHEMEEEDEYLDAVSPRSRQRRFLQGRLQEVRIYLNQLPNTYVEQFRGAGNISISVSPPERRSSFKHRSSSLVGDANESLMDDGRLYPEDQVNRSRMSQREATFCNDSMMNQVSVSFKSPVSTRTREAFPGSGSESSNILGEFSENISAIQGLQTPSTVIHNEINSLQSDTLQGMDLLHIQLQHKTSTPIVTRLSGETSSNGTATHESPNRSKTDSSMFKSHITKRKTASREKKKVAQVLLKRMSMEKRLSGSPIKSIQGIVNLPVIRKSSEFEKRQKTSISPKDPAETNADSQNSDEENVKEKGRESKATKKKKKDPPTKKLSEVLKPKPTTSPSRSGRPKRAARPKTLKEPNLNKKMRRSK